jgi:membrane-associated phospholipid phosphatase
MRLRHRPLELAVGGAYLAAFAASVVVLGVPTSRDELLFWTFGGLVLASLLRDVRLGRVILDWLPYAVALLLYDRTRGLADDLGRPVLVGGLARADRLLFGGTVPTVWLQGHLRQDGAVAWWEALPTLVYVTHFFLPLLIPALLWLRDRDAWAGWVRRFLLLSAMGLATYVLVPAAPPWKAAKLGVIGHVARTTSRGWSVLHLQVAADALVQGQAEVNRVAAIPSLHAGFAVLAAVLLWRRTRRRWLRAVLVAYPLAMGFTLVLCGEHYVVDVLLGGLYAAVAIIAVDRWDRRRLRRPGRVGRATEAVASGRSPS